MLLVLLGVMDLVKGAISVADISDSQYAATLSSSTVSWKVEMIAGFTSSSTLEVKLTTDVTLGLSHIWPTPEAIQFLYTSAGNASIRTGADVLEDQPLTGFNAILIRLDDSAPGSFSTEFKTITFNGVPVRNFFASDSSDSILITDFGDTVDLQGAFYKNPTAARTESRLIITGVNLPTGFTIPEISSLVLCLMSIVPCLFRRCR